jgi:hypothetical protein
MTSSGQGNVNAETSNKTHTHNKQTYALFPIEKKLFFSGSGGGWAFPIEKMEELFLGSGFFSSLPNEKNPCFSSFFVPTVLFTAALVFS